MTLKQVPIKTSVKAEEAERKPVIPDFDIQGNLVRRFNSAVAQMKVAKRIIEELEGTIKERGLDYLFKHNVENPEAPVSTVRLHDAEGAAVRITFQDKYGQPPLQAAEDLFNELKVNINDHLQQSVAAKFDMGIFISRIGEDEGEFSKRIFDAYRIINARTTKELIERGYLPEKTESPLATVPIVAVRAGFHEKRWSVFPNVDVQHRISGIITNTVTATPVVEA